MYNINDTIKGLNEIGACVLDSHCDGNKGYIDYIFCNCYFIVILKGSKVKIKRYATYPRYKKHKDDWIAKNY